MTARRLAIYFWYACVAGALYLHDWWSFALLAPGLVPYFIANSVGGGK